MSALPACPPERGAGVFAGAFVSVCALGLLTVPAGGCRPPRSGSLEKEPESERESGKWSHSPPAFAASEWRLGVQSGGIVPHPAGGPPVWPCLCLLQPCQVGKVAPARLCSGPSMVPGLWPGLEARGQGQG